MSAATKQRTPKTAADDSGAVPPGYKWTEVGVIPQDWEAVPLGELFVFKNGLNRAKRFFGFGTPIVNYMDVYGHPGLRLVDLHGRVSLSAREIKNFEVRQGDVFFTRTSETVEEIGVAAVMLDQPADTVFSGFVLRARPKDGRLDDAYKQYCFATPQVRSRVESTSTYTTRALTNGRSLSAVFVAVPPPPEQRAIAEALSDVDALLGAVEVLIAKKRAIKQAAMQQLLTGKTRLPGFSGAWETRRMAEDVTLLSGHHVMAHHCNTRGDGTPYLTGPADFPDGRIRQTKFTVKPTTLCRPGDILVTVKGSGSGMLVEADGKYCISRQLMAIRTSCWSAKFLFYSLLQNVPRIAAASTGLIPGLSRADLLEQELPLPSEPSEQTAIATVLSDMDAEIAALERRRDKTGAIKQGMMQQLLTGRVRLVEPVVAA